MDHENKTAGQLIEELNQARRRISELERSESELRLAAEALRISDEKYKIYFEFSNDIMFSYSNQLQVLYVSPNVERITGYRPEDLIGRSFHDLRAIVHPEDVDEIMENAQQNISGSRVYANIYRFITKDGKARLAEVEGFPVTREGSVVAMVSMAKDITRHVEMEKSLRESELRCRTTLQNLPNAVSVVRMADAQYLYANNCFCRMTGYSVAEIIGKTVYDLNLPVRYTDYDMLIKAMKYSQPVSSEEHLCYRKNRSILQTLLSARPIHYDGQECLVVVMTDLTPFRRSEQEKKRIDTDLAQFQKRESIRTLAEGIAHDFNNILQVIIGYTKMAASTLISAHEDTGAVRDNLKEVTMAAFQAKRLVHQLLTFSHHTQRTFAPVSMNSIIGEALKTIRPTLPERIRVSEHIDDPGMVLGDPGQISQMITNLCTNAVTAMGETGGDLEVRLETVDVDRNAAALLLDLPPGPYVRLTVSDTGKGMSPEVTSRIYDPYFTTRGKDFGSGLGLSVVHGIVKSHGGTITCRSSPGEGTSFDIYLPGIEPGNEAAGIHAKVTDTPGSRRVLDLDEDPQPHHSTKKKGPHLPPDHKTNRQ